MAKIVSIAVQKDPNSLNEFERLNPADLGVVDEFVLDSSYDFTSNNIELHLYTINDDRVESTYNYDFARKLDSSDSDTEIASILTINPVDDASKLGYSNRNLKLLYHFLDDLFSTDEGSSEFFIQNISRDRREIFALARTLSEEEVINYVNLIQQQINDDIYFFDFRLNFGNNDLYICLNIDTYESRGKLGVRIKLYKPLSDQYGVKSSFTVQEKVADSVLFEIDSELQEEDRPIKGRKTPKEIREDILNRPRLNIFTRDEISLFNGTPNFNLSFDTDSNSSYQNGESTPSPFFSYDDLIDFELTGSRYEAWANLGKKGIDVNIDYADFKNFVHFSSAEERVIGFKYKLDLINSYETQIANTKSGSLSTTSISSSLDYYEGLLKGVLTNFDHFDRHLFFQSGSTSWPKSIVQKPHTNLESSEPEAVSFYNNLIQSASAYDSTNYDALINFMPGYLKDDPNNSQAVTFTHMLGHHFDNIWIYANAVTDKYNNDNRLDYGISRELAGDILRNFGVRVFNAVDSQTDFYKLYTSNFFDSGSREETISTLAKPSDIDSSKLSIAYTDYKGDIYKRIYHNLPLLIKSKGTIKAMRALISSFGIPSTLLEVKQYGSRLTTLGQQFALDNPSSDETSKVRISLEQNILSNSSLTQERSIRIASDDYTRDDNKIEIGMNLNGSFDAFIIDNVGENFSIDDYIGNAGNINNDEYLDLHKLREGFLNSLANFNIKDFVRLIEFYDTTLFKSAKNFLPARASIETGIIVRPDLLNRCRFHQPIFDIIRDSYTGSLSVASISGSEGKVFGSKEDFSTSYIETVITPDGQAQRNYHNSGASKFDGELSGSYFKLTNGELNSANTFKAYSGVPFKFSFSFISSSDEVEFISGSVPSPPPPTPPPAFVITGETTATPTKPSVNGTIVVNTQPVSMSLVVNGGVGGGAFTSGSLEIGYQGLDFDSFATLTGSASTGTTETFSTVINVNGNYIYRVRITDNQGTILNKAFISGSI